MAEYMQTYSVPVNGSVSVPVPTDGAILGIYSPSVAIGIEWNYNGAVGALLSGVNEWEPVEGFHPRPTSVLILKNTNTTAADVTVRMLANE